MKDKEQKELDKSATQRAQDNRDNLIKKIDPSGYDKLAKQAIRPGEKLPFLGKPETQVPRMPGYNDVDSHAKNIADDKVSMMLFRGAYIKPDLHTVVPHYLKALAIKDRSTKHLGIKVDSVYDDCALGYGLASHSYVDEFGLTMTTSQAFPDYIVEATKVLFQRRVAKWKKTEEGREAYDKYNLNNYSSVKTSYPRGRYSGLPWIVPGKDRLASDVAMSVNALMAKILLEGADYDKLTDGLLMGYINLSRFQRTSKVVPVFIDGMLESKFFEPRRRVINAPPKMLSMVVKPLVAWHTALALAMPEFTQDRQEIRRRTSGRYTVATDMSRFDLRTGGQKLKQALDVLWTVAKEEFPHLPEVVREFMFKEATLPVIMPYGYPTQSVYITEAEALRSGSSTTSRSGSVINLMCDMYLEINNSESPIHGSTSASDIASFYVKYEPVMITSDDLAKPLGLVPNPGKHAEGYLSALSKLKELGMEAEEEKPTKFLGFYFHKAESRLQGGVNDRVPSGLFHATAPLNNMYFPERFKTNAVASMVMRHLILENEDANDAMAAMTMAMRDKSYLQGAYGRFLKAHYNNLEEHYSDHPSGAARLYFSTLPKNANDAELISKSLHADADEILTFLAKGAQHDFNFSLIGLPDMNEIMEESESSIAGSIDSFFDRGMELISTINGTVAAGSVASAKNVRKNSKMHGYRDLISIFTLKESNLIINKYRSLLPAISRRIETSAGDCYINNL